MKFFIVAIIFLVSLIAESVLPALFHFYAVSFAVIFLISLLLVFGNEPPAVAGGSVAAFLFELWQGFPFGSLVIAWLFAVALWQLGIRFLNINPAVNERILSVRSLAMILALGWILMTVMTAVIFLVERFLYRANISWLVLRFSASSLEVWFFSGLAILVCASLLKLSGYRSQLKPGKFYL